MDRFEKQKEFKNTVLANESLENDIWEVKADINKLIDAKARIERTLKKNRERAAQMWDSFTRILIASTKIEGKTNDDLYDCFYYIPEIDDHDIKLSHGESGVRPNTIDLREFFINAGFPEVHRAYDNRRTIFCKNILRFIINDLFSKYEYSSWEEVREDLIRIPDTYPIPNAYEQVESYKSRCEELQKPKSNIMK